MGLRLPCGIGGCRLGLCGVPLSACGASVVARFLAGGSFLWPLAVAWARCSRRSDGIRLVGATACPPLSGRLVWSVASDPWDSAVWGNRVPSPLREARMERLR